VSTDNTELHYKEIYELSDLFASGELSASDATESCRFVQSRSASRVTSGSRRSYQ
jgi:hypothetical protein